MEEQEDALWFKDALRRDRSDYERLLRYLKEGMLDQTIEECERSIARITASLQD